MKRKSILKILGSGNIIVEGKAEDVKVSIGGSGDIESKDLVSASADLSIKDLGSIIINAIEKSCDQHKWFRENFVSRKS